MFKDRNYAAIQLANRLLAYKGKNPLVLAIPRGAVPMALHIADALPYQTIAEHFETWFELASAGQFDGRGDHHTPKHGGGMTSRGPARGDRPFRFEVLVSNTQLFDWGNLAA